MLRIIELQSSRSRIARCALQFLSLSMVALVCSAMSSLTLAAAIPYGNFSAATVDYINVTENSGTDPLLFPPNLPGLGLFGMPTVTGNGLDFSPNNFFADSQFATPAIDTTDGNLTFGVNAKNGFAIETISFEEGGGLSVVGTGTDTTQVDVSATGFINVTEVDGAPAFAAIPINLTFNFGLGGNGNWRLVSEGFVNGFAWDGAQSINLTQWLLNNTAIVPQFGVTKLTVSLDNSLYAESEAFGGAFIDKKDFGGLSVTVDGPVIPEPTTWLMGMLGCLAYGVIRRSR